MSEDGQRGPRDANPGDAWTIIAYLLSGLLVWGGIGYLLDKWLGTDQVFLLIGLLVGMATSIYIVYVRYGRS